MGIHAPMLNHPDRVVDRDPKVLVGWIHRDSGHVIELNLQNVASQFALEEDRVESQRLLMTRNQAALLGQYLLDLSGTPKPRRRSGLLGLLKR